jgi:hypothetical protein
MPQHRPGPPAQPRPIPISEPDNPAPQPQHRPHHTPPHQPHHVQPAPHHPHHTIHPHHQQPTQHEPAAYSRPPVHEQPIPQPIHQASLAHHQVPAAAKRKRGVKPFIIIISAIFALSLFVAGYLYKSSGSADGIPAKIVKQVDYTLYFPSPMPPGYTYMKDTATFQIGQVFYKFSKGQKRVTVKEEPMSDPKPNLDLLQGYDKFDAPIGRAAIGMTFGHPTAIVVTHTTVITMNTIGGVTQDELKTAIANLQNIGQNSDREK